jgi:hypothetical protein
MDQSGLYLTDEERRAIASVAGRSTVRTVQFVNPLTY